MKTLTKGEIYDRLGFVVNLLRNGHNTEAMQEVINVRSGLLHDVTATKRDDKAMLKDKKTLMDVLCHKMPMKIASNPGALHVYEFNKKFLFMNSHMIAVSNKNVTDLKPERLPDNLMRPIGDILSVRYDTPDIKSFACPKLTDLVDNMKRQDKRLVNDDVVYHFGNGPSVKATLLMWTLQLTGAKTLYTQPRTDNGLYKSLLYFHGEDYEVYVCPFMTQVREKSGFTNYKNEIA